MIATKERTPRPKAKAPSPREREIADIRRKIETYRGIVQRAALGQAIPAHVVEAMEAILEALLLPGWTFDRDIKAARRHLAMIEEVEHSEPGAAGAIRDRAAELAFAHPHLLLPIELAVGLRLKAREKQLSQHAATRERLRSLWSTCR